MMLRGAALLLVILAVSSSASFASDKKIDDVRAGTFGFGSMAIGQAKDVDYARAEGLGLMPKSPLDVYLNGILAKLLAQSPVKGVPAHVYVRASGDWAAKTTADADIYVALGTQLRLDNEDEVAALLAHEASHVILGHADADIVTNVQQRGLQLSALAVEATDVLQGGTHKGGAGKMVAGNARVDDQSRALLLSTMIIAPAWTRGQERDADLLGIDLLARAGYSPRAMASLLRKQAKFESERAADQQALLLDKQLFGVDVNTEVREQTQEAARGLGVDDPGVGKLAGEVIGNVFAWGAKKVGDVKSAHPKTEERIADAEGYVAREYADSGTRAVQVESWEAAKDQDGTADILENYIAAIEAKGKLREGDLASARKLSKASLTGPTRAHAYPNYVAAAVEIAQGNSEPALAAYETALAGPEPAGAIYAEAAALYLRTGKRDKASEVIEAGYKRLQEPPSLTVPLIHTYRILGRQADAERVAAKCAMRWPKMQTLCADEAKGK